MYKPGGSVITERLHIDVEQDLIKINKNTACAGDYWSNVLTKFESDLFRNITSKFDGRALLVTRKTGTLWSEVPK